MNEGGPLPLGDSWSPAIIKEVPTVRPLAMPKTRFDVGGILSEVASNIDLASFLYATEPLPPTSLSVDVLNRFIGVESLLLTEQKTRNPFFQRFDASSSSEEECSETEPSPPTKETKAIICHHVTENISYCTNNDERYPACFLEKPSPIAKGVQRTVGLKLQCGPPDSFVILANLWHEDGRSTLIMLCYILSEPSPYSEKYVALIEKYPLYRFPRMSDVLELAFGVEEEICQFCILRGFPACQCTKTMVKRMATALPAKDQRTPWSLYCYFWTKFENSVRKYSGALMNFRRGVMVNTVVYHIANNLADSGHGKLDTFHHYLRALEPYLVKPGLRLPMGAEQHVLEGSIADGPGTICFGGETIADIEPLKTKRKERDRACVPVQENVELPLVKRRKPAPDDPPGSHLSASNIKDIAQPGNSQQPEGHPLPASMILSENLSDADRAMYRDYFDEIEKSGWTANAKTPCRFCPDRTFNRKHDLKRHIHSIHLKNRDYQCDVCGEYFIRKSHLDVHRAGFHDKTMQFICHVCNNSYAYYATRSRHLRQAHGIFKPSHNS